MTAAATQVRPVSEAIAPGTASATVPVGPPFLIHPLSSYNRYLKLMAYGDYGMGKTRLVGSAVLIPQMRDILFIDAEAGDLTILTEDEQSYKEAARRYMDVVRVSTYKQLSRVQEFLKLHCRLRDEDNETELKKLEEKLMGESFDPTRKARRYRTVIVDSLSEAETFSMYQLLGITDKTRLDDEVASPEWAEYKRNYSQILRTIRAFRDLSMNVLMTAAAAYIQDDQKRMLWQPALTGRLAKQCQGFMDVVGYMFVTQSEGGAKVHNMQVQPSARINAKCRFSNFKQIGWQNPTMLSILQSVGLLEAEQK